MPEDNRLWKIFVPPPEPSKEALARQKIERATMTPQERIEEELRAMAPKRFFGREKRPNGEIHEWGFVADTCKVNGFFMLEVQSCGTETQLYEPQSAESPHSMLAEEYSFNLFDPPEPEPARSRICWDRLQSEWRPKELALKWDANVGEPAVFADGVKITGQLAKRVGEALDLSAQEGLAELTDGGGDLCEQRTGFASEGFSEDRPIESASEGSGADGINRKRGGDEGQTELPLRPCHKRAKQLYDWAMTNVEGAEKLTYAELHKVLRDDHRTEGEGLPDDPRTFARYCRLAGIQRYSSRRGRGPTRSILRAAEL